MEDRSIVPELERPGGQLSNCYVGADPCYAGCFLSEACSGSLESRLGNIEHRDIRVTEIEEIVDERRRAAADVDDPGRPIDVGALEVGQRSLEMRPESAHAARALGRVDRVPVLSARHEEPPIAASCLMMLCALCSTRAKNLEAIWNSMPVWYVCIMTC